MTTRQVFAAAARKFLPSVAFLVTLPLLAEPLLRHRSVIESLRSVYLPLAIGEPFLILAGYASFLCATRRRVSVSAVAGVWRHVVAAFVAVAALGITSVFTQGAHLPFIIMASALAGVIAGIVTFGSDTLLPPARAAWHVWS